jgi:hypothetical protein
MMEVIVNPVVTVYQFLALAIGFTAITFIALTLWLDRTPKPLPVQFPSKPRLHELRKLRVVNPIPSTRR